MKKYISEFVGTLVLVLIGCGTAVITSGNLIVTPIAFGLVIVAMAYSIGNVSGCHINPAVSLAMLITKKMDIKDFIGYIISQLLGALAGAALLGYLLNSFENLGANGYGATGQLATNPINALIIETILTFIFITVILAVTSKKENSTVAGIVIGLTLTLIHIIGIPFTGTSVNPARSLMPALLQKTSAIPQVWVFVLAPLLGATLAALFYETILKEKK